MPAHDHGFIDSEGFRQAGGDRVIGAGAGRNRLFDGFFNDVRIAGIADAVQILPVRVGEGRAVIQAIDDAVQIAVEQIGIAEVAYAVQVRVELIRVDDRRAIVQAVDHAIFVAVEQIGIAESPTPSRSASA